jgi:DNA-binding HxlR family transcriptional regulator
MVETHNTVRGAKPAHASPDCQAVTETLARIGDKWTVMVIGSLSQGPLRYSQVKRAVNGISQRMLTLTLKGLEQDGLVSRTVYPTIPPRVDYELTDLGQKLTVPLGSIYDWAKKHRPEMEAARKRYAERIRAAASRTGSAAAAKLPRRIV